jgi:hypothetical protein
MATTAFDTKKALHALIQGRPELAKYQVTYGFPARAPERRWVFVGEVTWEDSMWATNRSREETYQISCVFNCQISGATSLDVEEELRAMAAGVEEAVKASVNLGISDVYFTDFVPQKLVSFPSDQVYEGQFECSLRVKARL